MSKKTSAVSARIISFPTADLPAVQQPSRSRGRFPKTVVSIQRARKARADALRQQSWQNRHSVIHAGEDLIHRAGAGECQGVVIIPLLSDGKPGMAHLAGIAADNLPAAETAIVRLAEWLQHQGLAQ